MSTQNNTSMSSSTGPALDRATERAVRGMIEHGASRRDVIGWLGALGIGAAAAGTMFTDRKQAHAATPKRGGRLIMVHDHHGPADTLDPAQLGGTIDYFRGRMFYGSLVRLTPNLGYEPELAEEILSNGDATVWTFKIRRGVTFHDGKTLTADDVIYSMNRHLGPDSVSLSASLVSMVDRWEKVDDYEVRAVLKTPNADLPNALGTYHFKIVRDGEKDFSKGIGTGPYRVAEFRPGVRAIGTRFEDYWDEGAYLDELESFAIGDPVSRVSALLAGDVDGIANLPPKSIETIENTAGKEIWSLESGAYINIACRMDMMPSGNADLIKAMQYLMDRDRLVNGVFKGHSAPGNDQPIGPAYFDHCPDIPQRALDPDKAKWHFQKSGVGSTAVPIVAAEVNPGCIDQCVFLQQQASRIGLTIDVKKVTTDGYWSAIWKKAPICVSGWNMRPTANILLTLGYKSDSKLNESYWKDARFDELLVNVRSVTDPDLRRQMYCDMQTMIYESGGTILPAHRNYIDAVGSYVQGRTQVPINSFGGADSPPTLWRNDI